MPIWFEIIVLMLVAYALGLAIGWLAWGTRPDDGADADPEIEKETD